MVQMIFVLWVRTFIVIPSWEGLPGLFHWSVPLEGIGLTVSGINSTYNTLKTIQVYMIKHNLVMKSNQKGITTLSGQSICNKEVYFA